MEFKIKAFGEYVMSCCSDARKRQDNFYNKHLIVNFLF